MPHQWRQRLAIAICLLCPLPTHAADPPPLRSALTNWHSSTPVAHLACEHGPAPQVDLIFPAFYKANSSGSEIDQSKRLKYQQAMKPIARFENLVSKYGDHYLAHNRSPDMARCLNRLLSRWANAGAFLGKTSPQGAYVRKWALATTATSYQKIADAPSLEHKRTIHNWLNQWTRMVITDYSTDTHKSSRNNNHLYWAAWAVMSAAVALDNREYWHWATQAYRRGIEAINDDGTFPLELHRKSKALHYHAYALGPLVMMAETAAENGEDLYGYKAGRLHRAIRTTLEGWSEPEIFARRTGHRQTFVGKKTPQKLIWLEPYLAHYPNPRYERLIAHDRPLQSPRHGGMLSNLYRPNTK